MANKIIQDPHVREDVICLLFDISARATAAHIRPRLSIVVRRSHHGDTAHRDGLRRGYCASPLTCSSTGRGARVFVQNIFGRISSGSRGLPVLFFKWTGTLPSPKYYPKIAKKTVSFLVVSCVNLFNIIKTKEVIVMRHAKFLAQFLAPRDADHRRGRRGDS